MSWVGLPIPSRSSSAWRAIVAGVMLLGLCASRLAAANEVEFGPVTLGSVGLTRQIVVENTGAHPMTLLDIRLNHRNYRAGAPVNTVAQPGGVITFPVTFTPSSEGPTGASVLVRIQHLSGSSGIDFHLHGTGVLDTTPGAVDSLDAPILGNSVSAMAVQPDGKILLGGAFTSIHGEPRTNLARLNADGTLDRTFSPAVLGPVLCLAVQSDGQILVGGRFQRVRPGGGSTDVVRRNLARFRANGTLDRLFTPSPNEPVRCLAVQSDGGILVGGAFTWISPTATESVPNRFTLGPRRLARLHRDGRVDGGFPARPNGIVNSLALQADGRIVIGGEFTSVDFSNNDASAIRRRIARLNSNGTLDRDFHPGADGSVLSVALQADGGILLGGRFNKLYAPPWGHGVQHPWLARLNTDGSIDPRFSPRPNQSVHSIAVQADGRILIAGNFTRVRSGGSTTDTNRNRVARIHPNGALDREFDPNSNGLVTSVAIQANGGILLGGAFNFLQPNGAATYTLRSLFARLYNDSTSQPLTSLVPSQIVWDRTGSAPEVSSARFEMSTNSGVSWIQLGHATRVGTTPRWQMAGLEVPPRSRLRARGQTQSGGNNGSGGWVESLGVQGPAEIAVEHPTGVALTDGTSTIPFGTAFDKNQGKTNTILVRNTGGLPLGNLAVSVDGPDAADFVPGPIGSTQLPYSASTTFAVRFQPGSTGPKTATVHLRSNLTGSNNPFDLLLSGEGLVDTRPGSVDDLNVPVGDPSEWGSYVDAAVEQADGRILLGGTFISVLGHPRRCLARVNVDGSLDTSFDPNPNGEVKHVMVQPDGRILISGTFTSLQPNGTPAPVPRKYLARLNADGSLDTTFVPPEPVGQITCMAQQPDGKILTGASLVRWNTDGTRDAGFTPRTDREVNGIAIQPDGKILVVGDFTEVWGSGSAVSTRRPYVARFHADGTLDPGFFSGPNNKVKTILLRPDGRMQITGDFLLVFTSPDGEEFKDAFQHAYLAPHGGPESYNFNFNDFTEVSSMVLQADGSVVYGGRNFRFQRYGPNESLDTSFSPRIFAVSGVSLARDGKVLVGGGFQDLEGNHAILPTLRSRFARLNNGPATNQLTISDTSRIVWNRGGTTPEISQVTFELSLDGGVTWAFLGAGDRVGTSPNWQLTGLSLPSSGHIRARGRSIGGLANSSAGVVETKAAFTGVPPP